MGLGTHPRPPRLEPFELRGRLDALSVGQAVKDVESSPQRFALVHADTLLEAAGDDLLEQFVLLGGKCKLQLTPSWNNFGIPRLSSKQNCSMFHAALTI